MQGAQADFSFNLALTGQREKVVDFGLPYAGDISTKNISQKNISPTDDPLTFCIAAPLEVAAWESIFRPFPSVHLWILVIITFISLGGKYYISIL